MNYVSKKYAVHIYPVEINLKWKEICVPSPVNVTAGRSQALKCLIHSNHCKKEKKIPQYAAAYLHNY